MFMRESPFERFRSVNLAESRQIFVFPDLPVIYYCLSKFMLFFARIKMTFLPREPIFFCTCARETLGESRSINNRRDSKSANIANYSELGLETDVLINYLWRIILAWWLRCTPAGDSCGDALFLSRRTCRIEFVNTIGLGCKYVHSWKLAMSHAIWTQIFAPGNPRVKYSLT